MADENGFYHYPPQHPLDSPDTFFAVQVQPSVSDSAQTPPSPVSYSKPRVSRSSSHTHSTTHPSKSLTGAHRSHISSRRSTSHRSGSNGPTQQFKRERERQLANTPRDTLIQRTISKEYELSEAKHLLTTALLQLEANREKYLQENEMRLALEVENKEQGVKTTRAIINTQKNALDAKEEVRRFQLQLDNAEMESRKFRETVDRLELERVGLEQELVRARATARTLKEKNALLHAREEGRREGFEEGLRQGRTMHGIIDVTQMPPATREDKGKQKSSQVGPSSSDRKDSTDMHTVEAEIELRKIAENEIYRLNRQLIAASRQLDQQRQFTKDVESKKKEETERLKRELRAKDDVISKKSEKEQQLITQLRARDIQEREAAERREKEEEKFRMQVEQLAAEKERLTEEKEEAERILKEELAREKERREKDKETKDAASVATTMAVEASLPYIAMPQPPIPINTPTVPRTTSSASQPQGQRRYSVGSQSSSGSAPLEMLQSPSNRLSIIHEVDDTGSASPTSWPTWPVLTVPQNISTTYGGTQAMPAPQQVPQNPHLLQPSASYLYGPPENKLSNGSQSSIQINIEPPSRPPSSIDQQEVDGSGNFLSPNHRPVPLPSSQETPLPIRPRTGPDPSGNLTMPSAYDYDTSGITTQPNSPVIPGVTVPMPQPPSRGNPGRNVPTPVIDGPLPPGFVPQTITDSRGVSAPIWQANGLPPPVPGVNGSHQALPTTQAPRTAPIYGNPLNKDREIDEDSYVPAYGSSNRTGGTFITAGSRPNGGESGMTPVTSPLNLPGPSIAAIYAPPNAPSAGSNTWNYSAGRVIPGPLPHSAPSPDEEEDEIHDIDPQTVHNTRINAGIGRRVTPDIGRGPNGPGYNSFRR